MFYRIFLFFYKEKEVKPQVKEIPKAFNYLIQKMCLDLANEQKNLMKKLDKVLFIWRKYNFPLVVS